MKQETEIALFEKLSENHKLGSFKVRKNEEESNDCQTWWDIGPLDKEGTLIDTFYIVQDKGEKWFEVYLWVHYPGNRDEPPSMDERMIGGNYLALGWALRTILHETLNQIINDSGEEAYHTEIEKEQDEYEEANRRELRRMAGEE